MYIAIVCRRSDESLIANPNAAAIFTCLPSSFPVTRDEVGSILSLPLASIHEYAKWIPCSYITHEGPPRNVTSNRPSPHTSSWVRTKLIAMRKLEPRSNRCLKPTSFFPGVLCIGDEILTPNIFSDSCQLLFTDS